MELLLFFLLLCYVLFFSVSTKAGLLVLFATRTFIEVFSHTVVFANVGDIRVNLNTIVGLLVVSIGSIHLLIQGKDVRKLPVFTPFVIFGVASLIGVLLSGNVSGGLNDWSRWISWPLVMFLVYDLTKEKKDIDRFAFVVAIAAGVVIALSGWEILTGRETNRFYGPQEVVEQIGLYVGGNNAGMILLALLPFTVLKVFLGGRFKHLYLFLSVSTIFTIFFTYTRTAWLGTLIFLVSLLLLTELRTPKMKLFVDSSIFIFALLGYLNYEMLTVRTTDILAAGSGDVEIGKMGTGRLAVWAMNIDAFYNSSTIEKLFGLGLRTSVALTGMGGHNDFLVLLTDTGLLGFSTYCFFLFVLFDSLRRFRSKVVDQPSRIILTLALSLYFAFIVMSFITGQLFNLASQWYISVFFGIALAQGKNDGGFSLKK